MNEISKMVLVTTIICSFSAVWLGGLEEGLKERIGNQQDYYIRGPAISELLKGAPNNPLKDRIVIKYKGEEIKIYPWIEKGQVKRVALERPGHGGYGGDVIVMTAVDLNTDKICGVKVTQHKETPGVGTRAMVPSYLKKYVDLSIAGEIKLKRDGGQIDAMSGATHSSEAICDAVNQAAKLVAAKKEDIIKEVKEETGKG